MPGKFSHMAGFENHTFLGASYFYVPVATIIALFWDVQLKSSFSNWLHELEQCLVLSAGTRYLCQLV